MQALGETEEYVSAEDFGSADSASKSGKFRALIESRYFLAVAAILLAIIAFCLGRISGLQDKKEPVRVLSGAVSGSVSAFENTSLGSSPAKEEGAESRPANVSQTAAAGASEMGGEVVASKSGSKYHFPWCAGAKQIAAKNKITFASIEAARAAGYSPASNCKGLK